MAQIRGFLGFMIVNITRKRQVAKSSKTCKSAFLKALGLMFSRPIKDFGLVFSFEDEALRPLHMMFVFYPIDVLFLDKNRRIVEIKQNLRPFALFFPKKRSQFVIELPKGAAAGCNIGDTIRFK